MDQDNKEKMRVGFMCLKCNSSWVHPYNFKESIEEVYKMMGRKPPRNSVWFLGKQKLKRWLKCNKSENKSDFVDIVKRRKSIRRFDCKPYSTKTLRIIIKYINRIVSLTPSAGNLRSFETRFLCGQEEKKQLAYLCNGQDFVADAQICVVFSADCEKCKSRYGEDFGALFAVQEATIACTYAMLAAENVGLSTCWIGTFDVKKVEKLIGVVNPVAILAVGKKAK